MDWFTYIFYIVLKDTSIALHRSTSPTPVPSLPEETFLPPTLVPQTIKEGLVEKKGHSVAFLMWPELVLP